MPVRTEEAPAKGRYMTKGAERIIFPLDLPTLGGALDFVELLRDRVGVFKVGLELFVKSGPSAVEAVRDTAPDAKIFLDLKFHDIPATVKGAVRSASSLGVDFLTVHASEGAALLEAVTEGAGPGVKVLGVTVLTSLSRQDLVDTGIDEKYRDTSALVLHRARLARLAGCAGVVCSGLEAQAVRDEFGPDFLIVTPGVRRGGDETGDQKRVVTPAEAIRNGADYIVVGRPIRNAPDPVRAAEEIALEVEEALEEKETENPA